MMEAIKEKAGGFIDRMLGRAVSRKLLVWLVATVMLFMDTGINGEQWIWLSLVYIGTQGVVDMIEGWKNKLILK